jgi:hypothetical protein
MTTTKVFFGRQDTIYVDVNMAGQVNQHIYLHFHTLRHSCFAAARGLQHVRHRWPQHGDQHGRRHRLRRAR